MRNLSLQNRTALVTGARSGIGKAIALKLAAEGCNVVVNFHCESAAETVAEAKTFGVEAFGIKADVGSSKDVKEMFDEILKRVPRLDILVNNAGVQTFAPLLDLSEEEWDRVINTNLKGCFLCTQAAARHMRVQGGVIINIGSGCNKVPFPRLVAYTASKGGIEMFTKVAAVELGEFGIRVNCVAPGAINNIWIPDSGEGGALVKFDRKLEKFIYFPMPQLTDSPKLEITRDGAIWYTTRSGDPKTMSIGVMYPDMEKVKSFAAYNQ